MEIEPEIIIGCLRGGGKTFNAREAVKLFNTNAPPDEENGEQYEPVTITTQAMIVPRVNIPWEIPEEVIQEVDRTMEDFLHIEMLRLYCLAFKASRPIYSKAVNQWGVPSPFS